MDDSGFHTQDAVLVQYEIEVILTLGVGMPGPGPLDADAAGRHVGQLAEVGAFPLHQEYPGKHLQAPEAAQIPVLLLHGFVP